MKKFFAVPFVPVVICICCSVALAEVNMPGAPTSYDKTVVKQTTQPKKTITVTDNPYSADKYALPPRPDRMELPSAASNNNSAPATMRKTAPGNGDNPTDAAMALATKLVDEIIAGNRRIYVGPEKMRLLNSGAKDIDERLYAPCPKVGHLTYPVTINGVTYTNKKACAVVKFKYAGRQYEEGLCK